MWFEICETKNEFKLWAQAPTKCRYNFKLANFIDIKKY